jgi:hypothetical protein
MRWAFVIQLASDTNPSQRQFSGRIEEVDSARELRFRSTDELLMFLGDCFARTSETRPSEIRTSETIQPPERRNSTDITSEVIETAHGGHVKEDACSKE